MDISPTTIALIATGSTLLGSLIPNLVALRTARLTKESEERKHQRALVINAALTSRNQAIEMSQYAVVPQTEILPLADYIVQMAALSDIVLSEKIDKTTLASRMKELEEFNAALYAERKRIQKQ
jgi:hypothetical protein